MTGGDRLRAAGRWCAARDQRWFVTAVVVAFALRVGWVLWAGAAPPLEATSDTGRNLAMAEQFSRLETYRLNGLVSAYNPPGYPLLLVPMVWLSRWTGGFAPATGAAVVNVVAGTATVVLGGVLAGQWFGRRARTAAAWFLAVAAGPTFLTLVALTETVFTAFVLGVLVLISAILRGRSTGGRWTVACLGALIGYTALIRGPGLLLLGVAVVALRQDRGSWRTAARPVALLVGTALFVLAPWTVRNAVQVGTWTPVATNSAAFLCQGHGDQAKADVEDMTPDDFADCFAQSPFDPREPDEAAWASRITRRALRWAVTHPVDEIHLTWDKTYATMVNDHQALADARDGGRRDLAPAETLERLDRLGEYWHRAILLLGLVALVAWRPARRAWPLWVTAGGMLAAVWLGNALDRYHHTTMALLAVLAGALLVGLPDTVVGRRLLGAWTAGHGVRDPMLAGAALAAAVAFDVVSWMGDTGTAERAALVLVGLGIVLGAVAGLAMIRGRSRAGRALSAGVVRLQVIAVAVGLAVASFVLRWASAGDDDVEVGLLPVALAVAGAVLFASDGRVRSRTADEDGSPVVGDAAPERAEEVSV